MLPFNLMKSEDLVWVFKDVDYFVEKTRTHYKGGSQGVSVRVMKGVYYRTGGFKGRPRPDAGDGACRHGLDGA